MFDLRVTPIAGLAPEKKGRCYTSHTKPHNVDRRGSEAGDPLPLSGLWSLWDMLKDDAANFVELGWRINNAELLWSFLAEEAAPGQEPKLNAEGQTELRAELHEMLGLAKRLALPTSMKLIGRRLLYDDNLPGTVSEFSVIVEVLKDELSSKLFLFVPSERAPFWEKDDLLGDKAKVAFPRATAELRSAGSAYAAGLPEGSIFYAMRAVEHGLRSLAADVDLIFDVQNWQNIINEIEAAIEGWRKNGIPNMDKATKDARLQFLSEAAKEFAYFKDGWRNYVAHAKVPYTEHQAHTVLNHVADFIERLSENLAE